MLVSACGGADSAGPTDGDGVLTVFAASSLTDVMAAMEPRYESAHRGVDVVVNLAGSSTLAAQVEQGAPADVFVSADAANLDRVRGDRPSVVVARNRLVIAVEPGNPRGIASLADLARPDLVVVLAAPDVPVGGYAAEALARAGVTVAPASLEQSVRSVASKVALGEADAGIVYRTDVTALAGAIDGVDIPDDQNVVAEYPAVALTDRPSSAEFVDWLVGDDARSILTAHGFDAP